MPSAATLTVAVVLLPLLGAAACFLAPRFARSVANVVAVGIVVDVIALTVLLSGGDALRYRIGGWGVPLGIDLHLDGLSLFMLLTTALTGSAVSLYGVRYFVPDRDNAAGFWPLWLSLWAAMNALFLSGDVFNLYVTLELMGLSAVVLVALAGGAEALSGAMRYLLMTMAASLTYLLGVALLYHQAGTLDIELLGARLESTPPTWIALCLLAVPAMVKSALFPLHFWLPPAHSSAPAPVSAVLSALVVKATVYLLVRLWLDIMPPGREPLGTTLALFGSAAIIWGSWQALRQTELKLLVAYSTVAQVGYLFLPFAIRDPQLSALAWRGAMYFLLCHALAKAAMFLAVGNLSRLGGSGRITELRLVAYQLPVTLLAFGVAGVTIVGLPPSGGFLAKWMLLEASLGGGYWWLATIILAGGLLSAAYTFKVVGLAFIEDGDRPRTRTGTRPAEWVVLLLALAPLALGFAAVPVLAVLDIGAPLSDVTAAGAGGAP